MSYRCATITYGSTGAQTYTLPFTPVGIRVTVGSMFGTSDSYTHYSYGVADGSRQHNRSIFQDATGGQTLNTSGKVAYHFQRIGGVITPVVDISVVSFGVNQVNFMVNATNANYQLLIESWD